MDIDWDKINKILSSKNRQRIEEVKIEVLNSMCCIAKEKEKEGVTIQGITAVTFAHNELELHKKQSDDVLLFKQELLHTFIKHQNMSLYRNLENIQEGDAIAIKNGKSSKITYNVIKVRGKELVVKPVNYIDKRKLNEQTIKIKKQNFICGIRLNKATTNTSSLLFFFFNYN